MEEQVKPKGPKKVFTTLDLVCLGINGVIGSGIFILPGIIAKNAGIYAPLLYLICGLFCFSIALCFAEVGSTFTKTGGAYVYASEAFGPFVGFLVGWQIWIASIIGWASVATGLLFALDYFYPGITKSTDGKIAVALVIIILSVLNFFGAKMGAYASNLFTFAKMIPLTIFLFIGISHINIGNFTGQGFPGWKFLSVAFLQVLYVYTGFEELPLPASEVKNPQKSIPKAIFIVLSTVTLFYVAIQFISQAGCPEISSAGIKSPLAYAAKVFAGNPGGVLLGIGAIVSMAGVNAGIALTAPRSLYALARDKFLPDLLAKLHPGFHTPYIAIVINTAVVLYLTLTGTFTALVNLVALASLMQYIPTCLAVITLRIKKPDLKRGYTVPGGLTIPIIAVFVCVYLMSHATKIQLLYTLYALMAGVPFYFLSKKNREAEEKKS